MTPDEPRSPHTRRWPRWLLEYSMEAATAIGTTVFVLTGGAWGSWTGAFIRGALFGLVGFWAFRGWLHFRNRD